MNRQRILDAAWRRSHDVADPRAQVSAVYWEVSERSEDAFRFFDAIRKAIWQYSDNVRKPGKPLPISANAMRVFDALIWHMDFRTGRCDPSLDTIEKTCKLSRRTVVRQLEILRREKLIDWARHSANSAARCSANCRKRQTTLWRTNCYIR